MRALLVMVVASTACAPPPVTDAGVGDAGAPGDAGPAPIVSLPVLTSPDDLTALRGPDGFVKFLAQVDGAPVTAPILDPCTFQNTTLYPFHPQYLASQPGGEDLTFDDYVAMVIRRATRVWWGGEVVYSAAAVHPITGAAGVMRWTLYTEDSAGNRLTLDDVRAGFTRLSGCTPGFAQQLQFEPSSNEQIGTARAGEQALLAEGIAVHLP